MVMPRTNRYWAIPCSRGRRLLLLERYDRGRKVYLAHKLARFLGTCLATHVAVFPLTDRGPC